MTQTPSQPNLRNSASANSTANSTAKTASEADVTAAAAPEPVLSNAKPDAAQLLRQRIVSAEALPKAKRSSVRTKATLIAIALAVVPVLVVGGITTYFANRVITARMLAERERLAMNISLELNQFVKGRLRDAEAIASAPFMVNPATRQITPSTLIVNFLNGFIKRDPTYGHIFAATPDGSFAFSEDGKAMRSTGGDVPLELIKPDNKLLAARKAPYFLKVRDTLRPAVSPLRISTVTGKPSFFMAVPAFNAPTGQLAYVIASRTDADQISKYINEQVRNFWGNATRPDLPIQVRVVDHGSAFYEKKPDGKQEEIPSNRLEVKDDGIKIDGKAFQPGGSIAQRENRIFVSNDRQDAAVEMQSIFAKYPNLRNGRAVTTTLDVSQRDQQTYLLAYAPVSSVENLPFDWGVLVYEPTTTAFAPQRTLIQTLLLGTAITAIGVGAMAAVLANRVARPILSVIQALEQIGQGSFTTRLNVRGNDEIAALGMNINTMTAQLQELSQTQAFETAQERLIAIAQGSVALRTSDLNTIFEQTAQGIRDLLKPDRVVIYNFAGSHMPTGVVAEAVAEGWNSAQQRGINDACIPVELREAYRKGRVLIVNNVLEAEFDPAHRSLLDQLEVKAILAVPMVGADCLFGLLIVHSCLAPYDWQEPEINFLKRVAAVLGLTTYRVSLLAETETLAAEQRQLKEELQRRALELLTEVAPISQGDLTIHARVTADEIGTIADSYNATVASLRKIVLQVQQAANQVSLTTDNQQISIQMLASEALRQAEAVAAALSLVQEMATATQAVVAHAQQAEAIVQQASQTVTAGDTAMNRTVNGIEEIRTTVTDTAAKVKHLGESSQKIGAVVNLINSFTAQTNLLAFNATIEASRAGEAGRGFAVVAEEVRGLAKRSAEATEEIKQLIVSIQAEINEVMMAMEFGTEQVTLGTQLVDETRQSLNQITAASVQVSQLIAAIVHTTIAHAQTSEVVTETMQQIAAIANNTSSEVTQVAASFEQLHQVAQVLQTGVGRFKV